MRAYGQACLRFERGSARTDSYLFNNCAQLSPPSAGYERNEYFIFLRMVPRRTQFRQFRETLMYIS
jgi:hypothetical protein